MVIDFHVHAFSEKIAQKAISILAQRCGIKPYTGGLISQTVECMDRWGVDISVLLSVATKPTQQTIINDWAQQQEGERFIPFGSVHPDAPDAVEEVFKIKQRGLHGIKFHPDYQNFMIDDRKMDPILDAARQTQLPVIFHSGYDVHSPDIIHCTAESALSMIKRNKDLKIILAHLGCNEYWDEVYDILAGVDGEVYFDTALTSPNCPGDIMTKIINKHGVDRVLFGSDLPWDSPEKIINKIIGLNISDDAKEKILGLNAKKVLGI